MEHLLAIFSLGVVCVIWVFVTRATQKARGDLPCENACFGCTGQGSCNDDADDDDHPAHDHLPHAPEMSGGKRAWPGAAATLLGLVVGGVTALALSQWQATTADDLPLVVERPLMGTRWVIEAGPCAAGTDRAAAVDAAFSEVARVESVMSEWQPDSPISAINTSAGGAGVTVPTELRDIILRSMDISRRSEGAFDISWRGMGPLWKLRAQPFMPPTDEAIEAARKRVDHRRIKVDGDRVSLGAADMAIGLGGIAKGYAVDRAVGVLKRAGVNSFFVDGGGDIRVAGGKNGHPWRVGVRHPRGAAQQLLGVVEVMDGAVVTSGDYERFTVHNGIRYHHIIDPSTGRPATASQAVTIVAPDAETADALATAVFILGPARGLALVASQPGTEGLVVDKDGKVFTSPGFGRVGRVHTPVAHLGHALP